MKKITVSLLILSLIFSLIFIFSSCNNNLLSAVCQHEWKAATCTAPATCLKCGESSGQPIPHSYTAEIVTAAKCNTPGTKKYTCSHCSTSYTEPYSTPYTATEIHDKYSSLVCEIITYTKKGEEYALGSGFVYSSDGKIITNFHVIDDAYSIKVNLNGQTYTVSQVLAYDKDIDLAVLKIPANDLAAVTVCHETHKVGSNVYAFGSSKGLSATFSNGIITHANREMDGVVCTQHSAPISSGNSGGPLINEFGEVIGINTFTIKDSQNLNFAINVSELNNLDYSKPLSVADFYGKECDPLQRMINYISANGERKTFDDGTPYYFLELGYTSGNNNRLSRYAYYYPQDNEVTLDISSNYGETYVYFTINEIDGVYDWEFFSDNNYEMTGVLYANSFTVNSLLSYEYENMSSELANIARNLSSAMLKELLSHLDEDLAPMNVTIDDLGFSAF